MKQKLLFLSSRPIFPVVYGGQIRTAQQLKLLVKKYDVDVLYLNEKGERDRTKDFIKPLGNVTCFHVPRWKSYLQTLYFLFNSLPLQVNYYYSKKVNSYVRANIHKYDVVFCNNIRTAEYVRNIDGIVKAIDFVDAISMNYQKTKDKASGIKRILYTIDYKRVQRYEQTLLTSFDKCAIISEVDKEYLLKWQKIYSL